MRLAKYVVFANSIIPMDCLDEIMGWMDQGTQARLSICTRRWRRSILHCVHAFDVDLNKKLQYASSLANLRALYFGSEPSVSGKASRHFQIILNRNKRIESLNLRDVFDESFARIAPLLPSGLKKFSFKVSRRCPLPPGLVDRLQLVTHLSLQLDNIEHFDAIIPQFKILSNVTRFEVDMWKFPAYLTVERLREMAPPQVGVNMILAHETMLSTCVKTSPFNSVLAKNLLAAGADPNLEFSPKRLRALNFCKTVEAAMFLLDVAHAQLVYTCISNIVAPMTISSIFHILAFLPFKVAQYIVTSPAANSLIESGGHLVPPGSLTPNFVNMLTGTAGLGELYLWLVQPKIMERLGGYTIEQLDPAVRRFIQYAKAYRSH